jgi:hypothetical protein
MVDIVVGRDLGMWDSHGRDNKYYLHISHIFGRFHAKYDKSKCVCPIDVMGQ